MTDVMHEGRPHTIVEAPRPKEAIEMNRFQSAKRGA